MHDEDPSAVCPSCKGRLRPDDPGVIYAVERCETLTAQPWGPTRETAYGMGRFFHSECLPEAIGWERRERPPRS
jgi:hypothetical protein